MGVLVAARLVRHGIRATIPAIARATLVSHPTQALRASAQGTRQRALSDSAPVSSGGHHTAMCAPRSSLGTHAPPLPV